MATNEKKGRGVEVELPGGGRLRGESQEAVDEALRAMRDSEERERRRRERWGEGDAESMTRLARRFPSLERAPGVDPWDADVFLKWLCSTGLSHGELVAARFVLGVWNSSANWVELAREDGYPYPEHATRFDFFEAMGVWDPEHVEAFVSWVDAPFWP